MWKAHAFASASPAPPRGNFSRTGSARADGHPLAAAGCGFDSQYQRARDAFDGAALYGGSLRRMRAAEKM
jgi:hypothetical protein